MNLGFYILSKEREPRFIGKTASVAATKFRNIELKPREWVDYYYGPDVNGTPAWANVDQTDRLIDLDMRVVA